MTTAFNEVSECTIIGRSSSHFTRVTRIFAEEMRVPYSFHVVRDLMSCDSADYGGNPALRLPTLKTPQGVWFGALNICRELWRQASCRPQVVWPEDLHDPLLANAQELAVQAMATEVSLIMSKLASDGDGNSHLVKQRKSLINMMSWLEDNAKRALAALPSQREFSYLEVTLFCLVTHLDFRDVLPVGSYPELNAFCQGFSARASVAETSYRFDAVTPAASA